MRLGRRYNRRGGDYTSKNCGKTRDYTFLSLKFETVLRSLTHIFNIGTQGTRGQPQMK